MFIVNKSSQKIYLETQEDVYIMQFAKFFI